MSAELRIRLSLSPPRPPKLGGGSDEPTWPPRAECRPGRSYLDEYKEPSYDTHVPLTVTIKCGRTCD
jgi:hypothetical protein